MVAPGVFTLLVECSIPCRDGRVSVCETQLVFMFHRCIFVYLDNCSPVHLALMFPAFSAEPTDKKGSKAKAASKKGPSKGKRGKAAAKPPGKRAGLQAAKSDEEMADADIEVMQCLLLCIHCR